jgi:hypothetical protein
MKTNHPVLVLAVALLALSSCMAQTNKSEANAKISSAHFRAIAAACAPDIPIVTLRAIVRGESAFHPYALSLDYPQRTAKEQGFALWIYFIAPTLGMLAAAEVYLRARGGVGPYCAKLHHNNKKRCIFLHKYRTARTKGA